MSTILPLIIKYSPVLALLISIVALASHLAMRSRMKKFFKGKQGKDLEEAMMTLSAGIDELDKSRKMIGKKIDEIDGRLEHAIAGVGVVRFNPFHDSGSNQSFAIALLDEKSNGVVISSLYSRERMSVFAKPISKGSCEYDLSAEEKESLSKAKVKSA